MPLCLDPIEMPQQAGYKARMELRRHFVPTQQTRYVSGSSASSQEWDLRSEVPGIDPWR